MSPLHVSITSKNGGSTPEFDILCSRTTTITRDRHFHNSGSSRAFAHDSVDFFQKCSSKSHQQSANRSMNTNTTPPIHRRSSVFGPRGRASGSDKHVMELSLAAPFNTDISISTRERPDEDLDRLAIELLDQLELGDESVVDDDSSVHREHEGPTPLMSPKPDSFVRHRPHNLIKGAQAGNKRVHFEAKPSNVTHTPQQANSKNVKHSSRKGNTSMVPSQSLVHPASEVSVSVNTPRSANKSYSSRMPQQASTAHPSLDIVYAKIVDLPQGHQTNQSKHTGSKCVLVRLLRHAKSFSKIRQAKDDRLVVYQPDSDECLGSLLSPPPGSSHFELQLVVCGLLRRDFASPYELYHFFLENGFFAHMSLPPSYTQWALDHSGAANSDNPFYEEGVRVGLEGDMDFLRTMFQQWCNAWHEWRESRPVPKARRA